MIPNSKREIQSTVINEEESRIIPEGFEDEIQAQDENVSEKYLTSPEQLKDLNNIPEKELSKKIEEYIRIQIRNSTQRRIDHLHTLKDRAKANRMKHILE